MIGLLPGSPFDHWMAINEPYRDMVGTPGGPGAPERIPLNFLFFFIKTAEYFRSNLLDTIKWTLFFHSL